MPSSYDIWRGLSRINGLPIKATLSIDTSNSKIGALAQLWITPDEDYLRLSGPEANDEAVCGSCPLRANGPAKRLCYVNPLTVGAVMRGSRKRAGQLDALADLYLGRVRGIRLGAYGDPGALPIELLQQLAEKARALPHARRSGVVGYTQRWRYLGQDPPEAQILMASCLSAEDAAEAQALGWRTYTVTGAEEQLAGSIACPNFSHGRSCAECMLCDGKAGPKSIYHPLHGANTGGQDTAWAKLRALREYVASGGLN